jgi:regulator of cell morphogenesis and NO signaling
MEKIKQNDTISEIVRKDYRTADVFRKYNINYCCGGEQTLEEACFLKSLKTSLLQEELEAATRNICLSSSISFNDWPVDFLIEYIIQVHHQYLKQTLPSLNSLLLSFVEGHKKKYPELEQVKQTVEQFSVLLMEHIAKEEESLFPYLKQISNTHRRRETYGSLFVRTLSKPLDQMKQLEQTHISAFITQLRQLTNNYHFQPDACTNHRVVYQKLKELDDDMVQHSYLENEILFPKAISMEQELLCL